jgi:hypothetical protein
MMAFIGAIGGVFGIIVVFIGLFVSSVSYNRAVINLTKKFFDIEKD